jgi:prepilin-type N-terminal cleavage/methylation domain-containing protein
MFSTRKTIFRNYTMVEILVVLAIVGIIMSIAIGGIGGLMGRQGASGAVRNISSELSLVRSYAVMKNSYVAFLLPDDNPAFSSFDTSELKWYRFSKARICLVNNYDATAGTAKFAGWIDGNDWDILPSGTCGYITAGHIRVTGIIDSAWAGTVNSSAVIFKPNGTVATGTDVTISFFMARYVPTNDAGKEFVYGTKSGRSNAWAITVNPFTGRASYEKKSY